MTEEHNATLAEEHAGHHWCPRLDRRAAIRLLGVSGLAAAAGCNGSSSAATTASTKASAGTTTASTTVLTASATTLEQNVSVTLSATVTPSSATGMVSFYDGTTVIGTGTLNSSSTTLATKLTTTGVHSLTAAYAGDTSYAASTSASINLAVTATAASCSASLEGEEGPYFVDDSPSGYMRSNILSNLDGTETQTGVPLSLTIYVFDSKNSCAAMQNVQVDIWSCNAEGIYSAESSEATVGQNWLRGYQLTGVTGMVQFVTIIPGWYSGRTTHIHLRFRSTYDDTDTSGSNTMQLFFDQALINTLSATVSPYTIDGTDPTTNVTDRVYTTEEDATTLLTLTGSIANGYSATFNAYMPIGS